MANTQRIHPANEDVEKAKVAHHYAQKSMLLSAHLAMKLSLILGKGDPSPNPSKFMHI